MSTPRRDQLLDLAEHTLEDEGLERFGINSLARAAGIRPPSLYKHFSGAADLEHALISRFFFRLGVALDGAFAGADKAGSVFTLFAETYRKAAKETPEMYRLATGHKIDRSLLEAGAEMAAMSALLAFFNEVPGQHDRARAAWAGAHGLVSLELADRFPPSANVDAAWRVFIQAFEGL